MNNIFNIYYKKQDGKINYFLADEKGIIKNKICIKIKY